MKITTRQERQQAELERLKKMHGPGLFAALLFNPMNRPKPRIPVLIRRGYESNIIDELNDFYTFKPWRPKNCRPPARTHKEQLNLRRRMLQAGLIRRLGRGRYGLVEVSPRA